MTDPKTPDALPPIEGVTHVPMMVDDPNDPTEWSFAFPNQWGARVELDSESQEEESYEDLTYDFRVLRSGEPVYGWSSDVRGSMYGITADKVQEHLDALAARPLYLEPLDAVEAGVAVLGKLLAATRRVLPELKDLHVWVWSDGTAKLSIGDSRPERDYRPDLRRVAVALGIESGWRPYRVLDRWTCQYEGRIDGRPVAISCEEPRYADVRPEPTPLPVGR